MGYGIPTVADEIGVSATADIIEARLPIAEYMLKTAGSMVVDTFHHTQRSMDYLKEVIKAIEALYIKNILQSFPEDGILASGGISHMESRNSIEWAVDPIDGIHNFIRGIPEIGLQLAIRSQKELLYASMYQPFNQEQSTATRGLGAVYHDYRTGQELNLSVSRRGLEEALVIYDGSLGTSDAGELLDVLSKIGDKVGGTRVFGVAMQDFSMIASGRAEAFVTTVAHPEDVAPGILLVREAGGRVTDLQGKEVDITSKSLLVSNGLVHDQILELLNGGGA
ncbi:inositol monophosphatase [Candidatus Saccharibacteria bacterium]|nr:inositol monophosphatase [Candidatus Saccharibacteria bacterium]